MANVVTEDQARAEGKSRSYAPSWLDRFHAWLGRLPGPIWLYYLGIWLVLVLLQIAALWGEGAYPAGTFPVNHIFIAGLSPFLLALSQVLDGRADAALATLRPVMRASEEEYRRLRYRLVTLPARPTLLASLVAVTAIILLNLATDSFRDFGGLGAFPISRIVIYLTYIGAWWVVAAFLVHTVHQLKTIHLIYTQHTRINLFNMRPLYGLSGVTALTGAGLTAITYGWMAINPDLLGNVISMAIVLPITILAGATFLWPLLGVHRLLEEEKGQLLDECSLRIESAIAVLHQRVDGEQLGEMDDLNKTIASLEIEQNLLERIPTWPWRPETVRLLITALALPLGLWLMQYVLQRVIGP
jgi:hypothetical protein